VRIAGWFGNHTENQHTSNQQKLDQEKRCNLRRFYPRWLLRSVIVLLLVANIFNLGADIGARGASAELI
jgi:hypothetical protein